MPKTLSPTALKRLLPWLVAVAFFMEALDMTILNTAVPTIADALGIAPLAMKAALTSYTISLAVFIPISGWIADRFGTRWVFFTAIAIFTAGSVLCGLSVNMPMLVASRIVQGCGGALMTPVGRITMVRAFPKGELVRAMSFVAIPGLIGPLLGPLAGGLIVGYLHWRVIFFVNIPMGLLGLWLVYQYMPDYRAERSDPIDLVGLTLFGSGIALLSYILEVFGEHSLGTGEVVFLLILALALIAAYGRHALGAEHPLLNLGLFRKRTFRIAVVGSFATRLGLGGMPFLLPLLYQLGLGYSAVASGLLIMPQPLAAMSLKMLMPKLLTRYGYRTVLLINTLAIGAMMLLFMTIGAGALLAHIVVFAFMLGFLSSLQYTSINTLVFADLSGVEASPGSTIASTVQQLSMSFGVAVASLLAAVFLGGEHRAGSPAPAMIAGIHWTFLVLGCMTAATSIIFARLRPGDGAAVSLHGRVAPDSPAHATGAHEELVA
ncbi:MAG TPA: DHA2 family efflux MFS transporter permease subunit [Opitutaceae bacterium]|jgi:EmrB/QacA subfamily drug resistance transporter